MNPSAFYFAAILFFLSLHSNYCLGLDLGPLNDSLIIDREYTLEATMLGFFDPKGVRNPVLRANKGDMVKITIVNGEFMTHDIAMEKLGIKSDVILEEGAKAYISFKALESDTYFCSIPGHRAAGMVGAFEIVEGAISDEWW